MSNLVLDASAVLAVLQQEPGGAKVISLIQASPGSVAMSSVNFGEVIGKLARYRIPREKITVAVQMFRPYVKEFSLLHAERSGELSRVTQRFGLSLGDRACLALAEERDATVLTSNRIWQQLRIGVSVQLIRD